jgi:hypothetical protein
MTFYTALYWRTPLDAQELTHILLILCIPKLCTSALKQNEQYIRLMSHEDDDNKCRRLEPLNVLGRIGWGILS